VAAAVAAVAAGVVPMFLCAALAPRLQADLGLTVVALGAGVAAFHAVSALASPRFGRWVGRVGPRTGLRTSAGIAAAGSLGIAAAGRSPASLVALLAVAGLANGASGPAAGALLARAVPARRRGLAFGAQQSGAPLAAGLAGLAASLLAGPLGWRAAFVAAALIALAAAVLAPGDPAAARPDRPSRATAADPVPGAGRRVGTLALAAVLASATSTGMMAFLVPFAIDAGIGEPDAGLLLGLVSAVALISRIGLGLAVDRWSGDAPAVARALLVVGAAGCLLLSAATPPLVVAGALLVGGLGWAWTGLLTLAVVRLRPEAPGHAVGVLMSGLFTGAVVGPLLVGLLAREGGFALAWLACAALALAAAITIGAARRPVAGATRRARDGPIAGTA
jgi:predicted MFS family arabinose efflux permease